MHSRDVDPLTRSDAVNVNLVNAEKTRTPQLTNAGSVPMTATAPRIVWIEYGSRLQKIIQRNLNDDKSATYVVPALWKNVSP